MGKSDYKILHIPGTSLVVSVGQWETNRSFRTVPLGLLGGPVAKISLPMQGVRVPSLVRELRTHKPHSQKTKTQNRSKIVTNSIKTLNDSH